MANETTKQRIEREIKEQMDTMAGKSGVPDNTKLELAALMLKHRNLEAEHEKLRAAYQEMCDRATAAEQKIKAIDSSPAYKLAHLRLMRNEDGLWLYIHSTTYNTDALILVDEHGHGPLVRKTIEGYTKENP